MPRLTNEETEKLYGLLKAYGFSPPKAREIVIDANRGDEYALSVCTIVAKVQPATVEG
jgi:hypothetical protein